MKNKRNIIFILFGVLAAVALAYFIWTNGAEKKYVWYQSYKSDSDQPYGTLFIKKMIAGYHPEGKFIYNDKKPLKQVLGKGDSSRNMSYVFIGQSIYLDTEDVQALGSFLESGGDAFIASLEPPEKVLQNFFYNACDDDLKFDDLESKSAVVNFYHDTLRNKNGYEFTFRFGSDDRSYGWNYFTETSFCDSAQSIAPLGFLGDDHVNFLKIQVGKGNLYLHSIPLLFTNYFMAQPDKLDYVSGVFSHLAGRDILWDEYSKVPLRGNNQGYNSPLYYILQQPSLKYAWWLLLLTVVLYVLFFAKRQQRVIPVLEPKTNTSLEFVQLVSALHYQNGNHLDMARKKMKYFLYFVRSKFGIHTETFRQEHIQRLSEKSGVELAKVQAIFDQYYLIEQKFQNGIEANRLLDLYYAIENFYKYCK